MGAPISATLFDSEQGADLMVEARHSASSVPGGTSSKADSMRTPLTSALRLAQPSSFGNGP